MLLVLMIGDHKGGCDARIFELRLRCLRIAHRPDDLIANVASE